MKIRMLKNHTLPHGAATWRAGSIRELNDGSDYAQQLFDAGIAKENTQFVLDELARLELDVTLTLPPKGKDEEGDDWRPAFRKAAKAAGLKCVTARK